MYRGAVYGLIVLLIPVGAGCGSCDEAAGSGSSSGDTAAADGAPVDGDGTTALDGAEVTDGSPTDTPPFDGGDSTGEPTDADGMDGDGPAGSTCSGTKVECDGTCVETRLHHDHCGGCGNSCASDQVCNSGQCTDSCPTGMTECANRCVDRGTNPDHCGSCGDSCAAGQACNHGECTDAIQVGSPSKCTNGGPNIEFEDSVTDTEETCSGRVAKTTFRWALCSCDDVDMDDELYTDAYDSSQGPYTPGGYGGGIGTNGEFRTNNKTTMFGSLWTSSNQGVYFDDTTDIKLQVHSGGPFETNNEADVRRDARIAGDVIAQGRLTFHQTLRIPKPSQIRGGGSVSTGNLVRSPVNVSTVCDRCDLNNQIPIRQIVRDHESDNDNAKVGLARDVLRRPGSKTVLELPCGEYYLSEVDLNDQGAIITSGHTAIYIGSDIRTQNKFIIKPSPGSTLDVFVGGDVIIDDEVEIGSPAYPANMRLYIGGAQGFELYNKGTVGAYIYALPGGVQADDVYEHFGGLYAQNFDASNKVRLHYDRAVLDADRKCPDDGGGGGGQDAGMDADSGSDGDADTGGGEPMCSQAGESCGSDDNCCAPLVCSGGTCQTDRCNNLYESCSDDGDCCTGTCACSGDMCECISG